MKFAYYLLVVCVNHYNWEFDYLRARLYLFVLEAGRLEVQHQQKSNIWFNVFRWKVEHHRINFCFRVYRSMFLVEFKADIADIEDIVDATMMSPLVRYSQLLEHGHHPSRALWSDNLGKIFFDINVVSERVTNIKTFMFSFYTQTGAKVPISTGYNRVVSFFQIRQRFDPERELLKNLLNCKSLVNHRLRDACQLSAERGQFWIEGWPNIVMKHIQSFPFHQIHNNHRKFDNLGTRLYLFILHAGSFEVQDKQVLKLRSRQVGLHLSRQRINMYRSLQVKQNIDR